MYIRLSSSSGTRRAGACPARRWLASLLVLAVLSACSVNPAALPPADLVARYGLQLQVGPYADVQPKIALDDNPLPCENLILLFHIRAGAQGLPPGLEVLSVTAAKLADGQLPADQAEGRIAGALVTARVRDTYIFEHLTTADNWSNSIALRPGEVMPPGMKKERVFHGAAVACRPRAWVSEDLIEVVVQLRVGAQTARMRAWGLYGMAG